MNVVTAWSYSRYADYELCPARFKYRYLDKLPAFAFESTPAMERGNQIHKQAENFIKSRDRKATVPQTLKYVSEELKFLRDAKAMAEEEWGFRKDWRWTGRPGWFGDDVWFRAKADVVVPYEDKTLLLGDWKTGKKYEANEDQIELFALAGFRRFAGITEVDTRLWYTDISGDNEVRRVFYADEVPKITAKWDGRANKMFLDKKFPAKPNDKCRWCPAAATKGGPCKFG